jgi:uncharacterized membrane protein YhaH (DUF805 family)
MTSPTMFGFLELLFSTSGTVGRAVWWLSQILTVVLLGILGSIALLVIGYAVNAADPSAVAHAYPNLSAFTPAEQALGWTAVKSMERPLFAVGAVALVVFWSNMAIEIKRWQDRGLPGGLVFIRFAGPVFLIYQRWHHVEPMTIAVFEGCLLLVSLFVLIQLGCLPGVKAKATQGSRPSSRESASRPGGHPTQGYRQAQPPRPAPQSSGKFILGFFCALVLFGGVGAAYFLGYVSIPKLSYLQPGGTNGLTNNPAPVSAPPVIAHAPAPAPTPPPSSSINDDFLNRERDDHDSMTTMYAKDWVIVDGEKLSGIRQVTAIPGIQVNIVYADGDTNVMAASLPPGFRDLWGITPEVLEAANKPKQPNP